MTSSDRAPVSLESLCRGPFFCPDTERARINKAALERHFTVEWASDIEATMATIHPDDPWQRIPALGVDVNGFAAVRDYYLRRFESWPGQAMAYFDRVSIADTCIYTEGTLRIEPKAGFGGLDVAGAKIAAPVVIVVDFRDGLVLGETIYVDGAAIRAAADRS